MRPLKLRLGAGLFVLAAAMPAPGAFGQGQDEHPAATAPGAATSAKPATAPPQPEAKLATAPPQPEAKLAAPAPTKTPGTEATVVSLKTIEGVMGKAVRSRAGNEDMGHIVDVLVDDAGQVRAAVIDFGGFLGVGSRKVAVDWKTLDFADSIASGSVKLTLTRDQVRQAPEYKPDEPIVVLEGNAAQKPAAAPPPPAGHNETAPAH